MVGFYTEECGVERRPRLGRWALHWSGVATFLAGKEHSQAPTNKAAESACGPK